LLFPEFSNQYFIRCIRDIAIIKLLFAVRIHNLHILNTKLIAQILNLCLQNSKMLLFIIRNRLQIIKFRRTELCEMQVTLILK